MTASLEKREYEIPPQGDGRDCDFIICPETPGNGIAVVITDSSGGAFVPELCSHVEVAVTTSVLNCFTFNFNSVDPSKILFELKNNVTMPYYLA